MLLHSLWDWALSNSLHGSVLVVCALLLQWALLRQSPARIMQILWLVVAIRLLAPVVPSAYWSAFNLIAAPAPRSLTSEPDGLSWKVSYGEVKSHNASDTTRKIPQASSLTENEKTHIPWLAIIWACGMVAQAVALGISAVRTRKLVTKAALVSDPRLLVILKASAAEAKLRKSPVLLESDGIASPAVCGLLAARLLLPSGLADRLTDSELRFIFLHECGHIRHGDLFTLWLLRAARLVHWFNPLVWLTVHAATVQAELASDEMVLKHASTSTRQYGETLLKLAMLNRFGTVPALAMGIAVSKRTLRLRITRLANASAPTKIRTVWGVVAIAGVTFAFGANEKTREGAAAPDSPAAQAPSAPPVAAKSESSKPSRDETPAASTVPAAPNSPPTGWPGGWTAKSVTIPSTGDIKRGYLTLASPEGREVTLNTGVVGAEGVMLKEMRWAGAPVFVIATLTKDGVDHDFAIKAEQIAQRDDLRVEIESRFFELTEEAAKSLIGEGGPFFQKNAKLESPAPAGKGFIAAPGSSNPALVEVLNQAEPIFRALLNKKGIEMLSAPRVTTRSGQRCVIEIIREMRYPITWKSRGGKWEGTEFETRNVGVTLEAEPSCAEDGAIDLELAPQIVELVGLWDLDTMKKLPLPKSSGPFASRMKEIIESGKTWVLPPGKRVNPIFSAYKMTTHVTIFPGNTVVLKLAENEELAQQTNVKPQKVRLVFVTAKLPDLHSNAPKEKKQAFDNVNSQLLNFLLK